MPMRLNGHLYWGTPESLEGWKQRIGSFDILDSRLGLRRYHANSYLHMRTLEDARRELQKMADAHRLDCSSVLQTFNPTYTHEKHHEIYLVDPSNSLLLISPEKETASYADKIALPNILARKMVGAEMPHFLSIRMDRPYRTSGSVVIDVTESLKGIHENLISSIDQILISKLPERPLEKALAEA